MKKFYFTRFLTIFFCFLYCFSAHLFAQTMPTPQTLPYTQTFTATDLPATSTTYPSGFQGWSVSTSPIPTPSNYVTSGTPIADRLLTASSSASTSSGNIHNYNGKIGFLNTGSLDLSIVFSMVTSGKTGIVVQYDAMVIRNPYDGATNTRINEMSLQYRVGETDAFTTLPETAYASTTVLQTGAGITTPQNPQTIKVTLPEACNDKPIVQIRWISKQLSGSGARPSFAMDNIDIKEAVADTTAPVTAIGYPTTSNIFGQSFDFSNKLDEAGKTYFVLLPSGSATPSASQVKAGLDANGTAALQSGFLDITDPSQVYVKNFTGLTLNTSYSVFSISEDSHNNIQSIVNQIDVTTSSVVAPIITVSASSLDLGFSEVNYNSESLSYQIQASNITDNVVLTAPTGFSISKDNNIFSSTLTFSATDFAANAAQTVYVRFTPTALGNFSGQITNESTGATTKNIAVSGIGINPYVQGFDDVNVLANSGWNQYNVSGTTNKWTTTTVARNVHSGTGAVIMNGYSDSGASKDWLISPKLHLDTFNQLPLLSFYSRKFYTGPALKLVVSTNYDGKSNPETATWTELNGDFPVETGTYKQSQYIDLSDYKTSHTYVAWVYETTAGGNNFAAEWSLDDIAITNESAYVASNPNLDFGDVSSGTVSASQFFVFKAKGYNDITITAPADYQISLDNNSFQSNVVVNATDAPTGKTIYVRFTPSVKALNISGALTVTGTALNKQIGTLTGSSLPKSDTFDIVTYNLEFFGTDVIGTDGKEFGPTDDPLQIDNVAKVMNKLNADVYVVQEVSDETALDQLIQKISVNGKTFDKTISPSWSYSFNAPEPNFPPQKLVVLYNTQTATVKNTRVMFKDLYDAVRAGTKTLPDYPGGNGASFFSSGRLPYMVQIETNLGGVKKLINLVDLHARANSGSDISKYNMRKYDAELLKDSLDVYYSKSNLVILGDFNDDVKSSVIAGNPSSYQKIVEDTTNYNPLTLGISNAGAYSFLSSGGFLDHIIISNELTDEYIPNSIAVYDPRTDISNYTNTTSDHGPVIARFELKEGDLGTDDFGTNNQYAVKTFPNPVTDVLNVAVRNNSEENLKLRIYDLNGRLVENPIEFTGGQNTTAIPIKNLRTGIYIYTLTKNNKVVFKDKIIKK